LLLLEVGVVVEVVVVVVERVVIGLPQEHLGVVHLLKPL
jgi:hypothetical protein